tara:strand:- start:210 stop:401 length:192 start_codon:yes stop_codon:yes gene_type:complete
MEENTLPSEDLRRMRASGLIAEDEVVVTQGDLLIAINVVTQARRMLDTSNMKEGVGKKRLLKG